MTVQKFLLDASVGNAYTRELEEPHGSGNEV